MLLPDGYHDVPAGKLAAVVTYLEMRARPAARRERERRAGRDDAPWTLRRVERPSREWYLGLFRRIGTEWLWSSRLVLPETELAAVLAHPGVEFYSIVLDGRDEGLLELDFSVAGECEIVFFGLTAELVGQGAGRWFMDCAIEIAWSRPLERFWLHTCSLDSPQALAFYIRSGFTPYARKVEVFDDPRIVGALPRTAAPQVPLIDG